MKRILVSLLATAMALSVVSAANISVVPEPLEMTVGEGGLVLDNTIPVYVGARSLRASTKTWMKSRQDTKLVCRKSKAVLVVLKDKSLEPEAYTLSITPEGMVIKAADAAGAFWGLQTITQIIAQKDASGTVACLEIADKPAFDYRGLHLDCCRHFFTVEEVKTFIDIIALHKLNVFHWHLTEDQGWRIEIKKYPLLTETGSLGEFYTRKDCREIVRYAAKRHITVIPEIEMPGHAMAALASYPELGCVEGKTYEVARTWGVFADGVVCLGKENTYEFFEDVLDEVCRIFPSEYIHIGGDEAPHTNWTKCPTCLAKAEAEGLDNPAQLQGYMQKRIESHLNRKGRRIIGWDEILDRGVTPTATVMSWRGAKGGIKAARQGNDVVMTPNDYFYLDYYQTADPKANGEPHGIGGYVPLAKCYAFDPYEGLDEEQSTHVIGIQANVWSEYIPTFDHVEHMTLPRAAALSEVAWNHKKTSYDDFLKRVETALLPIYTERGYKFAPYAFDRTDGSEVLSLPAQAGKEN